MKLSNINEANGSRYYRSDGEYEDGFEFEIVKRVKAGEYNGRYWTPIFSDAARYYADNDAVVVEAKIDDDNLMFDSMDVPFTTNTNPELLNEYFTGVPQSMITSYIELAREWQSGKPLGPKIHMLHGVAPLKAIKLAMEMYKYNKRHQWGQQVVMPLRNIYFSELKAIYHNSDTKIITKWSS